jgi:serine/threonine-protein kinase
VDYKHHVFDDASHSDSQDEPAAWPEFWRNHTLAHYRLLRPLGRGTMGWVFEAQDVSLKRRVALKVLPMRLARGERSEEVEQFLRGARAAAALDHPHVVRVIEADHDDGWYFLAMELIEGPTLEQVVGEHGPLPIDEACELIREAAAALAAGHRLGIVHRDVTPANLLIGPDGKCKLTDFGMAYTSQEARSAWGTSAGTPHYLAPEIADDQPATPASDQFSLAATLYFSLTGSPPAATPPSERELAAWPDGIAEALRRGLATEPQARFPSLEVWAESLTPDAPDVPANLALEDWTTPTVTVTPSANHWLNRLTRRGIWLGLLALAVFLGWYLASPRPIAGGGTIVPATSDATLTAATLPVATPTATAPSLSATESPLPFTPTTAPPPTPIHGDRIQWNTLPLVWIIPAQRTDWMRSILAVADQRAYGIRGVIHSAGLSESGRAVNLEFTAPPYTDQFHAVYYTRMAPSFEREFGHPYLHNLIGRQVIVKGPIRLFHGRPQIILRTPEQLELLPPITTAATDAPSDDPMPN